MRILEWRRENRVAAQNEPFELDYAALRREMVAKQLRARGIRDERVLQAMLTVPRHEFVPEESRGRSYEDQPVSIGEGQTISQPYMVASMAEAAHLTENAKVLEVGTGSGYGAAVLSRLARIVHTIESHAALAASAQNRLARPRYENVTVHTRDGSAGLPAEAPFDAIVVAAAAPIVPQPLVEQLAEGGRLIIPIGDGDTQELVLVQKRAGEIQSSSLFHCRFVPLVGRHGFHP